MSEIKFKVSKDGNEKKYIPLIRKMLSRSLSEIRECLSNTSSLRSCRKKGRKLYCMRMTEL